MTEKFQQIISQVIKDCPGAYNMSDDIIIVGATQEEHDMRLEKVVQKLNEHVKLTSLSSCIWDTSLRAKDYRCRTKM